MYTFYATTFQRDVRKLSKKYWDINKDYLPLLDALEAGHLMGAVIPGFFQPIYKARVLSADQKRGKRGGFRMIYYVVINHQAIYLLTMYAKAKQEDIRKEDIRMLLKTIDTG